MQRNKDDYCYREFRPYVKRNYRIPIMLPLGNGVVKKNGHVSLYAVTEEMATLIKKSGSLAKWKPVHYSSVLWLDLDSRDGLDELVSRLNELDWFFSVFFSGNKGYHICIKREAEPSDVLCHQDKQLVIDIFRDLKCFRDLDTSIYHALHIFRAIGSWHEKTRVRKQHLFTVRGSTIPVTTDIVVTTLNSDLDYYYNPELSVSTWEALQRVLLFHSGVGTSGSRYQTLWRLSKDLAKIGLKESQIYKLCEVYNDSFDNPHGTEEIKRACQDGIRAVYGERQEMGSSIY